MKKVGDRVGAICGKLSGNKCGFFGYGVYEGDFIPPPGVTIMGLDLNDAGIPNPKILLDNGKVVWGCECWWGSEEEIKKRLEGMEITMVDPDTYREECKA